MLVLFFLPSSQLSCAGFHVVPELSKQRVHSWDNTPSHVSVRWISQTVRETQLITCCFETSDTVYEEE